METSDAKKVRRPSYPSTKNPDPNETNMIEGSEMSRKQSPDHESPKMDIKEGKIPEPRTRRMEPD
jgi:hypothetical protein